LVFLEIWECKKKSIDEYKIRVMQSGIQILEGYFGIFENMGVQEEKHGGAGRSDLKRIVA